ncbi:MAG: efflux RND transporter permease subunit [Fretibacterium sp.]|nr:efflux RND transporter permease subunit [Fretibacterium sp.]
MNLPELSVRRRVSTLMVFLAVILVGGIVFVNLKLDLLPEIEPPVVNVLVTWPGASASDVEQRVTKAVENRVSLLEGVDSIFSKSLDNISVVNVKFKWGENLDARMGDVRDAINIARRDLPEDAEEPFLLRITSGTIPILIVSLTAERSFDGLHHFAERTVKETLSRVPGVGQVLVYGGRQREIQVQLDLDRLEAFRIPAASIVRTIEGENLNIPAGSLKQGKTEYYVRVPGRFHSLEDLAGTVVGASGGNAVHLRDVAEVRDTYKDVDLQGYHYDRGAVILPILKNSDANTVEVTRAVIAKLAEMKAHDFPADVDYSIGLHTSEFILNSIGNLSRSLGLGILLVFAVTWIFLKRLPASLIVCGAIPFSLVITFIFMGQFGYTINIFTLSALAMASGMVVDNCIVATDQIVHHMERGTRRGVASIVGATEVQSALVASTLTTVVVLLPLAFIGGLVGIFFSSLTVVMVAAVAASLFVSLTFVPMMGSVFFRRGEDRLRLHRWTDAGLVRLETGYQNLLDWSLSNRGLLIAGSLLLLVLTAAGFRYVGTELTPDPDTGEISIQITLPEGTRMEETDRLVVRTIAHITEHVPEALSVFGYDGVDEKGMSVAAGQQAGTNIGNVGLKLVDKSKRSRSAAQVGEALRAWLRTQPGIEKLNVVNSSPIKAMFLGTKPLNVEVFGDDLGEVLAVSNRVKSLLSALPGAVDVGISQKQNRPEIWVDIDREKAMLHGVSTSAVAATLRAFFYGHRTRESYWEGEDDYPIRIRLQADQRNARAVFDRLTVPTAAGGMIRLSTVARIADQSGPPEIQRKNKQRYVVVDANVHGRSLGEVTADARRAVRELDIPPGITLDFGGEIKEQAVAFRQMALLAVLGVILVYMVMAGQYEAFLDPFVIMFSIPFALTGVVFAYLLTGLPLSLQGLLGVVMLVGIVVNNAIVLLDYVNLLRARGAPLREALSQAGARRLRPVLMTTLTTFFGMLPMAVSNAQGAELWRPLAVSVMGGLMLSTAVTLLIVPVMYSIFEERIRKKARFREARPTP